MLELYIDERGEVAIENIDALLTAFPKDMQRAIESALKSEGYDLKNLIKEAIRRGGVNGEWQKLNPHTGVLARAKKKHVKNYRTVWKGQKGSKKRVRQYKQQILSKRQNPLSKLAGAVRYKYDKEMGMVSIGFIQSAGVSAGMLKLAGMQAKGFETKITPKSRKMLFALGFPIKKSTSVFKTPARPVIEPVFKQEKDHMMQDIERKFFKSLARYWEQA